MKIAIFGSNSEIARDLIINFSKFAKYKLILFSTNKLKVKNWLKKNNIKKTYKIEEYNNFFRYDDIQIIINFIGVARPEDIIKIKSKIINITDQFDKKIIQYLKKNKTTKYIFISSGVVYCNFSKEPASSKRRIFYSRAKKGGKNWYLIAKLKAEKRHRNLKNLNITDLRVFNYFSHTQDFQNNFFISGIIKSIIKKKLFLTSNQNFHRDYVSSKDFFKIIKNLLKFNLDNQAIDCYTKSQIDKFTILKLMHDKFGLKYKFQKTHLKKSPTSEKIFFYSKNYQAKKIRYSPTYSSKDNLIIQTKKYLNKT